MKAAIALYPTAEQIQTLLAGPDDWPVVMLNLLRFKPQGDAPYETMSGEAASRLYAEPMGPFVDSKGGRVLWSGHVESPVIGEGGDTFPRVALVAYPSRQAFLALVTNPFGSEIALHRASGLEG